MNQYEMGLQDFFTWRSQTVATTSTPLPCGEDEEMQADEPPDSRRNEFCKLQNPRPQNDRKVSLLTKAFHETEISKPEIQLATDLTRRRSMMSNASLASASTAELTSDGGLTSPARTNTPSPPLPRNYTPFAPYSFATKPDHPQAPLMAKTGSTQSSEILAVSPKDAPAEAPPKKRCITFMCDGKKGMVTKPKPATPAVQEKSSTTANSEAPQPRKCTIKFACPAPKTEKPITSENTQNTPATKPAEPQRRVTTRSPSIPRKSPKPTLPATRSHRDSTSTVRRASQSPVAFRAKPKYIIADEKTINQSEATRFHEFASETIEEDDWILKETEVFKSKLTISDTLKKENAIRQLGNEAEAEALEDEEIEDADGNDSDDEIDFDDEEEEEEEGDSVFGSDDDASDGNETDNEAGFAESDDETDGEGDFSFWTPGRRVPGRDIAEPTPYRPSAHRTASTSSIDSLNHMEPTGEKRLKRRPIKIRPGTPDLPDSTDFVCGTLDEDRPLENAYVSCMEARKNAKHKHTPQDIDPSFPTSDPEDEEDENDDVPGTIESEDQVWLHGKFEESDDERYGRRRSTTMRRKSPAPGFSPRRLHSPPPPKQRLHSPPPKHRLRSPPPRKLFGHSPKRMRSPPPARTIRSPPASPSSTTPAIAFAPLGSRPGLTHTKSLPRTPNAFCRAYHASRLKAANGNASDAGDNDAHIRGAIDIVKGLEQKRQRRKEKYNLKQGNRKNKGHSERKPQPGKGAERMRELGLLMAGKTGAHDPYMLSA